MHNKLIKNLRDIILKNYKIKNTSFILLLYDNECNVSKIISDGYKEAIKEYKNEIINFNENLEKDILEKFSKLPEKSLVILVESNSFRITKHRLRIDLFNLGHQVIEHSHLSFIKEDQINNYISSLEYKTPNYIKMCEKIKKLLNQKTTIIYESENNLKLIIDSEYENPITNTGDFTNQTTASSGFPIGEIFTEAKELNSINGDILVFGFPVEHKILWAKPFKVTIKNGFLESHEGPKEFEDILNMIKNYEGNKVQIREIGFGLNEAIGFNNKLDEPIAFERFAGAHFSLGLKHAMYRKKISKKINQKYHIDIFCNVKTITIGKTKIFENGVYQ